MVQHFINLLNWSSDKLTYLLDKAIFLKHEYMTGGNRPYLKGKTLAMIFQRASLRTRISFEIAIQHLGGHSTNIDFNEIGLGKRESISDVTKVLGRYVHSIVIRIDDYADLVQIAKCSPIPVINGLTKYNHPCQIMADVLTMYEEFSRLEGLKVVYVGHSNQDVARSLLFASTKFGFHLTISSPENYLLDAESIELARASSGETRFQFVSDPHEAVRSADVIYTDVWISVTRSTDPVEAGYRGRVLAPYQINDELMAQAPSHAIVMHCMPANRGQEITDTVADGYQSRIFEQAENRLHIQKSILLHLMGSAEWH